MQRVRKALFLSLLICGCAIAADAPDAWPRWRGPEFNGVARGGAPLTSSDKDHHAWKVGGPGERILPAPRGAPGGPAGRGPPCGARASTATWPGRQGRRVWRRRWTPGRAEVAGAGRSGERRVGKERRSWV